MLELLILLGGIAMLVSGAEFLVSSSSRIARHFGVSELLIGITLVALGTSLPELATGIMASVQRHPEITISNVVGSNIYNIAVVLGLMFAIRRQRIERDLIVERDMVWVVVASIWMTLIMPWGISTLMGIFMLIAYVAYLRYLHVDQSLRTAKRKPSLTPLTLVKLILGIVLLWIGADATVKGAVEVALLLQVPQWAIGATIIALGTSLPETVTSLMALLKKKQEMALGDVLGSNIFNIFVVGGASALFGPLFIDFAHYALDFVFMLATVVIVCAIAAYHRSMHRRTASILLGFYTFYVLFVILRK